MEIKMFENCVDKQCALKSTFTSEYQKQFRNNCLSGYRDNFEPAISHTRPIISKELHEHCNSLQPRHPAIDSTYYRDYESKVNPEPILLKSSLKDGLYTCNACEFVCKDIDPISSNYKKYSDIYATTNILDFRNFGKKRVANDAVTIWDWLEVPKTRGRHLHFSIPICKSDLDTSVKFKRTNRNEFVPHRGLVSEQQEEFSYKSLQNPRMLNISKDY